MLTPARPQVLRLEHEVLQQRLVLDVGRVLGRAPRLTLAFGHVGAVLGRTGVLDVVGHDNGARAQPPPLEQQLQIREVGVLAVVEEHEVDRLRPEAVLGLERVECRAPVAEHPDHDARAVVDAGVPPDPAGDLRVVGAELDRDDPRARRHHPCHAQGAVAAVRAELEDEPWRGSAHRSVEQLALLVADVDHEAPLVTELVDDADDVIEVSGTCTLRDVGEQRLLAPVARQLPRTEEDAQDRPAQKGHAPPADLS